MVNRVTLVGRIGKDPEVRNLENGAMVANFTMATSEKYKDRVTGEKKEIVDWHNIVVWRGLAEIAQKYLHKGDMIYIEGKMRTRSWEKEGVTRYTTEVIGDQMTMLSTQRTGSATQAMNNSHQSQQNRQQSNQRQQTDQSDFSADNTGGTGTDDLPF